MANPFKRSAVQHRPALRPVPGTPAWKIESEPAREWTGADDDEDSDWAMWEDSIVPDRLEGDHAGDS